MVQGYPQVGLLGDGLFATAFLGYTLASRLRATEARSERRGIGLANVAQLNERIIRRMQSGVLACNQAGHNRCLALSFHLFFGVRTPLLRYAPLNEAAP